MVFEPGIPSEDPDDKGYAPGELELLINLITAHLFAEAHNRNFFTQGVGSKGILHIKGDLPRAQLEGFKRQWDQKVTSSRNAFRPPIVGGDDVKWVPISESNRDMEFDSWMNYLIRMICAIYQIDPAEINFDISKVNSSSLNETSNEQRIKSSRDKGLRPLLHYVENIINRRILPQWNIDLANEFEFKFVGLDAETRSQEIDRIEKETRVWKTINEARNEMGYPPVEGGDIIKDGAFTQFRQMEMQKQMAEGPGEAVSTQEQETPLFSGEDIMSQVEQALKEEETPIKTEEETKPEESPKEEPQPEESTEKAFKVEYYNLDED